MSARPPSRRSTSAAPARITAGRRPRASSTRPPSRASRSRSNAHGSGASVTGGYVYRGESEGLHGQYFFADFVTGQVWTLQFNGSAWTATERTGQISPDFGQINNPSSFGEDARGNLYLVDFDGDVFRLTPQVASADQGDDLRGGGGDDMVFGGSGADRVFGEAGRDALDGGPGDDLLDGGEGADQILGGAGADTVSYLDAPRAVLINLFGQAAADGIDTDVLSSIENAVGSAFNDTIIGDAGANVLDGGREGSDQIFGGGDLDTVSYAASPRAVLINLAGQVTADGINTDTLSSIENAIGSGFDDVILSSDGVNRIDGGGGTDTVSYVAAPRAVLINLAAQLSADGIFTDTLASIENATGSAFADRIVSGAGANVQRHLRVPARSRDRRHRRRFRRQRRGPRRGLRVRRLRPRRDVRPARRHALAGQLGRRHDPRDHHPAERRRGPPRRRALRLTLRA
ncbi:MAG: hypothetical protein ACJ8DS_00565 [Microvirga sp.]